jgi:hypothetical protein
MAFAAALLMSVSGCKNVNPDTEQAAVIVNPNAKSRMALQEAVDSALRTNVLLSEDALVDSSVLVIERQTPQSIEGSPAQGRIMEMPIQFRLVKSGADCVLIDQRDLSRTVLADTECVVDQKYQAN